MTGSRKERFVKKAILKFGNRFNYDEVDYIDNATKVRIKCNGCGDTFLQAPLNHLKSKYPCPHELHKRKLEMHRKSNDQWISSFKARHGDKYDYSRVNCKRWTDKIEIICPVHGVFTQEANSHMQGNGCFKCSLLLPQKSGLKRDKDLYHFYFAKISNDIESFLKVGVTSENIRKRLNRIVRSNKYIYDVLFDYTFNNFDDVSNFESSVKSKLVGMEYIPISPVKFKGAMECFDINHKEDISNIIKNTIKDIK